MIVLALPCLALVRFCRSRCFGILLGSRARAGGSPIQLRACRAYIHRSSVEFDSVDSDDCLFRVAIVRHLHKGKASGFACLPVCHDPESLNSSVLFKDASNVLVAGVKTEVSYEDIVHLFSFFGLFRPRSVCRNWPGVFQPLNRMSSNQRVPLQDIGPFGIPSQILEDSERAFVCPFGKKHFIALLKRRQILGELQLVPSSLWHKPSGT